MNNDWSRYVQGIKTLYLSRKLRFDDVFSTQYKSFFNLDESEPLNILEIGCGPGALAGALHRWYPRSTITAIDRDSEFIRFAKENEDGIDFAEADATALPFDDNTFDITISNTVSEHVEPSAFFGEQHRVLKPNGICLVLSSRKGINTSPNCFNYGEFEEKFWEKVNKYDNSLQKFSVGKYHMNESELPLTMERYGFRSISTAYASIDLTPDDPKYSKEMAYDMINANRYSITESIESVLNTIPDHTSIYEIEQMKKIINQRYEKRLDDYNNGKKYWETDLSIIMMIKGVK